MKYKFKYSLIEENLVHFFYNNFINIIFKILKENKNLKENGSK